MELLPVTEDYDHISTQIRAFSARELARILEALRPYVDEALSDPGGLHDLEPSRLVAYTQLLKLHTSMIKDLGALYRVADRPVADDEEKVPASTVAALLAAQEAEFEVRMEAARLEAAAQARADVETARRLSLEAARREVAGSLRRLTAA